MVNGQAELHFLCGKIAAGKSTLSKALAAEHRAVVLSEDEWLPLLYPDELLTIPDYVRYSNRLKKVVGPLVRDLLAAGMSVVLDFPANTVEQRHWMKQLADSTDAPHTLHHLDVPDEVCRARLKARNAEGAHPFEVTDEQFEKITSHFVPPSAREGFRMVVHTA
ncbi:AAA family ATPase [Nioella nitratireducens]|uniref:AAA family ATPase n=1 Tax=Nioella nitratireducens TaxID=1287720 RepID=UPI0008FCF26F|nr:ATP-binding protein [Nioella nitratireducens]